MFICGSGSFSNEDEISSPCHTPKRSRRSTSFCKKDNSNKNPFADRGLDKFYALLADLDSKKQKIYTQKGSEDISFVRFVYANDSDKIKPIVVKVKEKKQDNNAKNMIKHPSNKSLAPDSGNTTQAAANAAKEDTTRKKRRCLRSNGSFKLENFLQPYYYFPVAVVMILLFLAMYGRSFAVLCTSIGWYLAPTIVGGSTSASPSSASSERKPKRKKEYVRKQSDVKQKVHSEGPSSPKSVINGLTDNLRVQPQQQQQRQQQHGRKKSW